MSVCRLRATNLRKIRHLDIAPGEAINLFFGSNGSGKTTVLEALHLLNSGRSFRTGKPADLVTHGEERLAIRGDFRPDTSDSIPINTIKVQKSAQSSRIEIDEVGVSNASTLAKAFPLLIIDPNSFAIVEGAPKVRRSLLDRAAFHVEQAFLPHARSYGYALYQRNRLLKSRAPATQLAFWDEALAEHGQAIHLARERCVNSLNATFANGTPIDAVLGPVTLRYRRGWPEGASLADCLKRSVATEMNTGSTSYGPHKAEIEISASGGGLARIASRGQIKVIIIAIITALVHYIFGRAGFRPVLLVDDFAAELDNAMRSITFKMLRDAQTQVFLTSIDNPLSGICPTAQVNTFHVEHGSVNPFH